jgi:uncharacterized protein (UPF0218 family)
MLRLPGSLRAAFKNPLGPVYGDTDALLADAGTPVVAVGDVVTAHLLAAGATPAVAVVDGLTKRGAVDDDVASTLAAATAAPGTETVSVENPAGTITEALLAAVVDALAAPHPVVVDVDGEEDLAALPAVLAAPEGASVVYGQPDEGMVLVVVAADSRARARDLLSRMDGDVGTAIDRLEAAR